MTGIPDTRREASVERAKREILADIAAGRVPDTVKSFSELHDYVDANEYGGLTTDFFDDSDEDMEFAATVQDEVDRWLQSRQDFVVGQRVSVDGFAGTIESLEGDEVEIRLDADQGMTYRTREELTS